MYKNAFALIVVCIYSVSIALPALAQDKAELEAEQRASSRMKGKHPLFALIKAKNSSLKNELENVHPRVFLTQDEIDALKAKTKTQPELWRMALSRVRALTVDPPSPPAETRRAQNEVGIGIAEAAFVYKITGDMKYLDAARKYMDAAVSYEIWGYSYNKPNVDLAAGHLLYGLGWAYDLLYNDLSNAERAKYRDKLIRQSRLLYDYFKPKPGKTYSYSQNHTFIPIAGLGVAAYALYDEVPEAKEWAALSRAIYDRVLATYSEDGYYYEGMEYWIFSTPWLVHYMDAHLHSTGEDLYAATPGLRSAYKYVAHATLPGGEFNFDFGDVYAGPTTRARKGDDYDRERIDGHFRTNYNILYNLANRYQSAEAQGVADWLKSKGQVNAEEFWTLIWYDPNRRSIPIESQQKWAYFEDHGVFYWRGSWSDDATAFAFKAGPPEGHAAAEKLKQFPDWRLSSGHAHPDAGSFIIWSKGRYLTGDSGYAGVPLTEHHNAVIIDGYGQGDEGKGHDAFEGVNYNRLDQIKISKVHADEREVKITSDLKTAYEPKSGVQRYIRTFLFTAPNVFEIEDDVSTDKPTKVTSFVHADNSIAQLGDGKFELESGRKPSLEVTTHGVDDLETRIEKNILVAPGKPGSVDKGEREERGVRLVISTRSPSRIAKINYRLRIIN